MDQGRPVPSKPEPPLKAPGRSPEMSPRPVTSPSGANAASTSTPFNGANVATRPVSGRRTSHDSLRSPMRISNPTSPTVLSAPAAMNALASDVPAPSTTPAHTVQHQQVQQISPRRVSSATPGGATQTAVGAVAAATRPETAAGKSTPQKPPSSSTSSHSATATAEAGGKGGDQQQGGGGRPQQKEMTKAERRALQEAQRAAKAAGGKGGGSGGGGTGTGTGKTQLQKTGSSGSLSRQSTLDGRGGVGDGKSSGRQQKKDDASTAGGSTGGVGVSAQQGGGGGGEPHAGAARVTTTIKPSPTIELFAHLPQFRAITVESVADRAATANVPIECVRVGIQMAEGSVRGANARCAAMLDMFTAAIQSFKTSSGRIFAREFGSALNAMVAFLVSCRPLSPAMGNVIKAVKAELGRIAANPMINDGDAKTALVSFVTTFAQEKVHFARETLARQAAARITEGDIILTYARSSTVEAVLLAAAEAGTRFSVVVVDSRPLLEGKALLTRLLKAGIPCEYVLINGMMSALSNATKVMLGAGAVFSNGAVLSRAGTAVVAMSANAAHVPVMVCSETYKFHDKVQLDSVTYNELGDPAVLTKMNDHGGVGNNGITGSTGNSTTASNANSPNLSLLNLEYDTTPAEFVTVVVTEVGVLPPTSVPVVLREYRTDEMV
ncbi:putative translation initiation factor eIF-2B subunit delta [Nannochloris sp. 'desiccata']|nr:putative translation initiation factor eIF-2B subunit delta [Chlorella desiccata (nom. nud.)]